jgi:hypothetical protein
MRADWAHLSKYRVRVGEFGTDDAIGRYGAFQITRGRLGFVVIAASAEKEPEIEWEHVSVRAVELSHKGNETGSRTPTWAEMCAIKALFWDEDECVVQFHPPKADYVNRHPHVLHLWKLKTSAFPRPPKGLV